MEGDTMKRVFAVFFMLSLLLIVSCGISDTVSEDIKDDIAMDGYDRVCEAMFVKIRTVPHEGDFTASVIDSDGGYHPLPDDFKFADDWQQIVSDAIDLTAKNRVDQRHLDRMRRFVNEFEVSAGYGIKVYEHTVWDYGNDALYVIYINSNGDVVYKQLCRYGGTTQCIDKDSVRDFVNWMIENRYFQVVADFRY